MKYLIPIVCSALLLAGCAKKEKEHQHSTMKSETGANPHAGKDMSRQPDPHAGMTQDPQATRPSGPAPADPTMLSAGKISGKLPEGWKAVIPASTMRLAQVEIPAESGDQEGGELVAFYFGPDAGGVEANIERWYAQFQQPDGRPTKEVANREEMTVKNMKVTIVSFTGSTAGASMPGAPSKGPREKWMNLSAIVQTPDGPFFLKGTGPEKTMKANEKEFRKFLKGIKFLG